MGLGFNKTSSSGRGVETDSDWAMTSGAEGASAASAPFSTGVAEVASATAGESPFSDLPFPFLFFRWLFDKGAGGGAPGTTR